MATVSPDEAAKRIAAFAVSLEGEEGAAAFATLWVKEATAAAGKRPTPQARMSASGLEVAGTHVVGGASKLVQTGGRSVPLGDVIWGSEFGSDRYPQFGPKVRSAWLWKSAGTSTIFDAFEVEFIDKAIAAVTR